MRYRARFQRPTTNVDSEGDGVKAWTTVATVSVALEPAGGEESTTGGRQEDVGLVRVHCQRQAAIAAVTANWRIQVALGTSPQSYRTLEVVHPERIQARGMEILCRERT